MVYKLPESTDAVQGKLGGSALVAATKIAIKRFAKNAEKTTRKAVFSVLGLSSGVRQEISVTALHGISRIIVIRPNYRIGNAILSTAIIAPLQERFPGAQIDFLVTDKTAALFVNLPVEDVVGMPRSAMRQPWLALSMVRELRAKRYDLAVQLAPSSLSGLLISTMVGARYVIGKPKNDAAWYDIKVKDPIIHAYDAGPAFSRALGTAGPVSTQLVISNEEMTEALGQLQALGLQPGGDGRAESFVAVFVGGHADKICPLSFWLALIRDLNETGKRFVVFVGPEESVMIPHLQQALESLPQGVLCPPKPLRIFAAMLAQARLMVTPDSGPMHMAAALGVPVVTMVQTQKSLAFIPPGAGSQVVLDLNVSQTLVAVERYYYENDSCAFFDSDRYAQAA